MAIKTHATEDEPAERQARRRLASIGLKARSET